VSAVSREQSSQCMCSVFSVCSVQYKQYKQYKQYRQCVGSADSVQ